MYYTKYFLFYLIILNIFGINSFLFGGLGGGGGGGCCCCCCGGGGGGGGCCCGGGSRGYGGYGGGGRGAVIVNCGRGGGGYGGGGGGGGCCGQGSCSGGCGGGGGGGGGGGNCGGCDGGNSGPPQISCSGDGCSGGGPPVVSETQACEPKYVIVRPVGTESGGYAKSVPVGGCGGGRGGGGGYAQEHSTYTHQQIPSGAYESVQLPAENTYHQQQPPQQYEVPVPGSSAAAVQSPPANQELPLPPTEQVQPSSTNNEVEEEVSAPSAPTNEQLKSEPYRQQKSAIIKALHGSKTTTGILSKTSNISKENTEICNSIELSQLMETLIVENDANESKRRLHKATNQQFITEGSDRGLDVICAPGAFSYRIATDFFCERTKGNITCFVYQQQP